MKQTSLTSWKNLSLAVMIAALACGQRSLAQVSAASQTVITSALGNAAGVAVDPIGNLYISDGSKGVLSVSQGSNAALTSVFSGLTTPGQVAVDANRNVYIANGTSSQVLEIPYVGGTLNVNGTILLGKGLGTVTGVAVDLSSNVYIVDSTNKQVVKISGTTQTTIATGLTAPKQIAVDRLGNVYIADAGANSVVYLAAGTTVGVAIGSGFNAPAGVATDASNNIYVADTNNGRVVEIPVVAGVPSTAGQIVLTSTITAPVSLALDLRGDLYVASGSSVLRYTAGSIYYGLLPVGTTSQTFPVTLTFTSAVTPATIKVLTTGLTGLDYKDAGGSTCTAGTSYAVGNSCVVNVTFTPGAVGPRYGAIVMYDASNKVLVRVFLGGGGLGAMLTVDPGTAVNVIPTNATATPAALANTRGITADNAGNVFVADYNNGRILEVPAAQSTTAAATYTVALAAGGNSVSINGAGDLVIGSGSTTVSLYPYENGTWSVADIISIGTGMSKARTVKVDVGGNMFWCDNGTGKLYENHLASATTSATQAQLVYATAPTGCLGIAVDLYGNVAAADSSTGKAFYAPATGASSYETGTGFTSAWGIGFDASGSIWINSDTLGTLGRIPNENGTLVGADQILAATGGTKGYDFWVDPGTGNIFNTPTNGSTTPTNYYVALNRLQTTQSYPNAVAIGATTNIIGAAKSTITSPNAPLFLSNSGNQTPVYSNGGETVLYDTGDFPLIASTPTPAGTPTGTCSFAIGLAVGFTCDLSNSFSPLSSGTRTQVIEISSNATNNPTLTLTGTSSTTVSGTVTLALAQTTPASGSPNPAQPLVFTATATPASGTTAATGALTLTVDGVAYSSAALSSGSAVFSLPAGLALGTHTLGLTYAGDKNFTPITTAVNTSVTVVAATSTTTLVASAANVDPNQSVTLTATVPTVSGLKAPTGTVTFKNGGTTINTVTLTSGLATLSTSFPAAGTETITAVYSGDSVYNGSASSAVTVTVGTYTTTATALSVTPAQPGGGYTFGTSLTVSSTVTSASGTPAGNVNLLLDGAPFNAGTLGGSGVFSFTTATIGAGTHSLIAFYSGSSTYDTSASSTISFTIIKATTATTLSLSPSATYASVPVTLTAQVTNVNVPASIPTGTVVFTVGAATLGSAAVSNSGSAVLVTTLLPAGADSIKATYSGDNNDQASTSTAINDTVTIVPTTTTISAAPSVVVSGGTSTVSATVVGNPVTGNYSGTVTFTSGGVTLGTANLSSSGVASFTTAVITAPTTVICASYGGSTVYNPSSTSTCVTIYLTNASGSGVIATATLGSGLSSTAGAAVDISGNLYITDVTKGLVALVAGGAGTQITVLSSLKAPAGLAVDGAGDLFIANGSAGQVTKILSQNGALVASTAKQIGTGLGALTGVGVDTAGNVYAADATNKQLVKIAPAGAQTVLSSTLINPQQVAVDLLGDIYVADGTGNRVVYITAAGVASTVGTGLLNPTGVAVDPFNNVYISDTGNNRVIKIPFVSGAPSTATQSTLIPTITAPGQLAVDRHQALFIGQGTSIFKWEAGAASFGVIIPTTSTPNPTSPVYTLAFTFAQATTAASINVLTAGLSGSAYKLVSGGTCAAGTAYAIGQTCTVNVTFSPTTAGITSGAVTFAATTGQPLATAYLGGVFYAPAVNFDTYTFTGNKVTVGSGTINGVANSTIRGVAVDPVGNVYVCDQPNARILQTNTTGSTGTVLLTGTSCASLALDGAGNLIIDDMGNNRMLLVPNEGGVINGADAFVAATGFSGPRGMTLDGYGNIVVADTTNARAVLAPIGGATTAQNYVTNALVKTPYDAAIDWQGNLAVIDTTVNQIVYLPATGALAATVGPQFCSPYSLAMDGSGAVFVGDISNTCTNSTTGGENVVRVIPGSNFYDVVLGHTNSPQGMTLDAQGNLFASYASQLDIINRSTATPLITFGSTAVGSTTVASTNLGGAVTSTTVVVSNGGPGPLTVTNPTGTFFINSGDFSIVAPGAAAWAVNATQCAFGTPLAGAAGCAIGIQFNPLQSGTRTAAYATAGNEVNQPQLQLTGIGTGGATTATTITLAQKTPAGVPLPYTPITLATTLSGGTGTLTGTVTVSIDGVFLGQQAAAASLTFSDPAGLSPGFHTAVATYSGDANNTTSVVSVTLTAAGPTPSVSVLLLSPTTIPVLTPYNYASSPVAGAVPYYSYTPVTLTATITGTPGGATPTGAVEFFDGVNLLGTAKLNAAGVATLVYSGGLAQGTHQITADYAGDGTYSTAVSTAQTLSAVYPGDYVLSLNPSALTLSDGGTASIMLTAAPLTTSITGLYNGQIGFTCSGLPTYATCAVSPNTVYLDGTGAAASAVLTIITQSGFAHNTIQTGPGMIRLCLLPGFSLLLLLGAGSMRRRGLLRSAGMRNLIYLIALGGILSPTTACGSHTPLAAASGTYAVTITATGTGGINHTIIMQVTLK